MKRLIIITVLLVIAFSGEALPATPERIVSLAPSMTEILFALGLGDRIVGVTTFCDRPEEAREKPKIGGMSNPSLEAVISLRPDIVMMTTDGNPREFEERLRALGVRTYVFVVRQISELPRGIREMGAFLEVPERAEALAKDIEKAMATVPAEERKSKFRDSIPVDFKALFIVWPEPLIVAGPGTAIDDALSVLGATNIASDAKTTYPKYSVEEVIRRGPDVIFIGMSMGADIRELSTGLVRKLESVPAVKKGNVCYVGDYLYRLGPRVVEGIEELARCLR